MRKRRSLGARRRRWRIRQPCPGDLQERAIGRPLSDRVAAAKSASGLPSADRGGINLSNMVTRRTAVSVKQILGEALSEGEGLLRLAPCWVPRSFLVPGGRLKLHPHDLYALGAQRGGIDERWFSSTTPADNGPGTPPDEGLSYIDYRGQRVLLRDAVAEARQSAAWR